MKNCRRKSVSCNKVNKNCGCKKPVEPCGCNKPVKPCGCSNGMEECSQYKKEANEKCEKAEFINNKANKIAQEALAAEKRAECLREQAIQECERANDLWDEYNRLAQQGVCLMKQAEHLLSKSSECYANLYEEVEGCDLSQFGHNACHEKKHNNCGCDCDCDC